MAGRPKPQKRAENARLLSEVVADNVRAYRTIRRISQDALAARMVQLGHGQWTRSAVSEVERGGRQLVMDELLALAIILEKSVPDLLDPTGPGGEQAPLDIDYGLEQPMPRWVVSAVVRDVALLHVEWPDGGGPPKVLVEAKPEHTNAVLRAQVDHALEAGDRKRAAAAKTSRKGK